MQKKLSLIIINLLLLANSFATNKQDSIYHDLYQFLILNKNIPNEMDWILKCDSCKQYLYIFNILNDEFPNQPDFVNIPFGIYKFQYNGCIDCGYYILIKYNESYMVYPQEAVSIIIKKLITIKKENPDIIDDKLFEAYIEAIIDDKTGMYPSNHKIIVSTIGYIEFVVSWN